jgi:hypothetical protein
MDEIVGVCMSDRSSLIVSWNGENDTFKNFEQSFTNKERGHCAQEQVNIIL